MPTDWLLAWSDITITTTTPHHDLMIIVMTFSFIIIMNFTIIIIRMTALTLSLSFSLSDTRLITMAEWKGNGGEEEAQENHSLVILLLSVYDGKIGAYHRPSS